MMRKCSRALVLLLIVIVPVLLLGAGSGRADERDKERNEGPVKLLSVIGAQTCALTCAHDKIVVFDISWVDPDTQRYYLADRTNNAIDVIDAKNGVYLKQINKGAFKGFTGSNDTSGPNGVVVSGHWLFVTDAPSKVWSIDLRTETVVDVIQTDMTSQNRADELAYDPHDGIILAVNNADKPPFATLITVNKATGQFIRPTTRITFSDATNGAEQPVWNPRTRRFYISIPEVNCPTPTTNPLCGSAFPDGAVKRINPNTATIETTFPVEFCQPAGLTLGPHGDLLLGCSETFDKDGHHWDPALPTPNPTPKQVIMKATTGDTTDVPGVGGSDEVWFNPGDGHYYTASRNNPVGPALGVIDAESKTLIQVVPTVSAPKGTAHSVAVNPHNNHAFVPLPANNRINGCANGCIAVYGVPNGEAGEDD